MCSLIFLFFFKRWMTFLFCLSFLNPSLTLSLSAYISVCFCPLSFPSHLFSLIDSSLFLILSFTPTANRPTTTTTTIDCIPTSRVLFYLDLMQIAPTINISQNSTQRLAYGDRFVSPPSIFREPEGKGGFEDRRKTSIFNCSSLTSRMSNKSACFSALIAGRRDT